MKRFTSIGGIIFLCSFVLAFIVDKFFSSYNNLLFNIIIYSVIIYLVAIIVFQLVKKFKSSAPR